MVDIEYDDCLLVPRSKLDPELVCVATKTLISYTLVSRSS